MTDLEKKIYDTVEAGLEIGWPLYDIMKRVNNEINQAMRENAVEFDKFIYNKWRLNEGPSPDTWIYYDVLNNIKTPDELYDLFMDSKTKSK